MAFCYEIVGASQLGAVQPSMAEPTATPAVAPSKASYSSCRVDGPYIAMTFDDGPHPILTPRLLDMLKVKGIKATFFLIGQNAADIPILYAAWQLKDMKSATTPGAIPN